MTLAVIPNEVGISLGLKPKQRFEFFRKLFSPSPRGRCGGNLAISGKRQADIVFGERGLCGS